jgi:DNA-binding NarL/FixJ family response regulator
MAHVGLEQEPVGKSLETGFSALSEELLTVMVVDDHVLIRQAFSQILSSQPRIERVIMAQDYAEARHQATKLQPHIIWLDMHITHSDSISEIGYLRKLSPASRIIVLADLEDEQEAFAAIMAGAQGYRSKQELGESEITAAIEMVNRGEFVLRPVLAARLVQRLRTAALPLWGSGNGSRSHPLVRNTNFNGLAQLTAREREILQLISQGYRDHDIADGLHISEKTVQKHVQSILSKLGAQNRTEAAYLIHRQSLIET